MNSIRSVFRHLGVVTILLAMGAFTAMPAAQAQMATPAAPAAAAQSSFCGNQPLCYEANDFTATITDFRTSNAGGYKVIDVDVRFQNKTNQPLILTYVAGSGTALDDRGNRYGVGGGNALRGIGQSYGGNNFDPKFNLRPGGFGDAQFELLWAPGQTPYGLTFELNLTVDEINTIEGNQHTMGGEFPLHYRGLANGVTGGAPGQATAFASQGQGTAASIPGLPPCGTTATTLAGAANSSGVQVPASANNAVSNATTAFSNLGSLFGKKKAAATAPPAAANTASAAPCAPATGAGTSSATTMTPGSTSMSATSGTATPSTGAASSTAAAPVAKAATTRNATAVTTRNATPATTTATTTAKPVPVVAKTPAAQSNATVKKPVPPPAPQKPASTTTTTNQ